MGSDGAAISNFDFALDNRIGADANVFPNFDLAIENCGWVNYSRHNFLKEDKFLNF